jgi:gluconate kinase
LTVGKPHGGRNPLSDTETNVRLHRVTDWVTKDVEPVADALHDCDLLAIRVREVLRGTSERIAMRWVYAVEEHLLGFIERADKPDHAKQQQVAAEQRRELARIESYYLRTAAKAGRIVYVSGMLGGATLIAAVCSTVAIVLTQRSHAWNHDVRLLLLCAGAGAVGALVSVLSRMSAATDKFAVDFEVGRALLRRLGLYKPLVGSVFGVGLYFLLASGLVMTKPPQGKIIYFYAIAAFLAGFSERFTGVMFGGAERLLSGDEEAHDTTTTTGRGRVDVSPSTP